MSTVGRFVILSPTAASAPAVMSRATRAQLPRRVFISWDSKIKFAFILCLPPYSTVYSLTPTLFIYIVGCQERHSPPTGHDMHWDKVGLFLIRTEGPPTFRGLVTENYENNIKVSSNKFIRNEVTIS